MGLGNLAKRLRLIKDFFIYHTKLKADNIIVLRNLSVTTSNEVQDIGLMFTEVKKSNIFIDLEHVFNVLLNHFIDAVVG